MQVESGNQNGDSNRIRFKLEALEDLGALKASDLRLRIQEMERIKGNLYNHQSFHLKSLVFPEPIFVTHFCISIEGSVSAELRDLEAKRQGLQQEIASHTSHIEELKLELARQKTELERVKMSVVQVRL